MDEHPLVARVLEAEPDLGAGDESLCLPGWINSFCEKFESGQVWPLTTSMIGAIAHTLIAARQRARRLVIERDAALSREIDCEVCEGTGIACDNLDAEFPEAQGPCIRCNGTGDGNYYSRKQP